MQINDSTYKNLQQEILNLIRQEAIPGAAFSITNASKTLWESGFGVTDQHDQRSVTPDTLFSLQSCSKVFTATAILIAVQQGLLDLDLPINEYLPGFKLQSRFESCPERLITLRVMLSHKAGLTHEAPLGNNYTPHYEIVTFEDHIQSIQRTWLRYPVGQRYAYSNLGIDLAGYILQHVSGVPFAEYVRQKLFLPLEMTHSTFDIEAALSNPQRASGHDAFVKATGKPLPQHIPMLPSGGLFSSASDVARFIRFQLNQARVNGKTVLDERYLQVMLSIPNPMEGQFEGYGLGVAINRIHNTILCHHGGGGFGFQCNMQWISEEGVGVVFLTNSANHSSAWNLPHSILTRLLGARQTQGQPAPKADRILQNDPARRIYLGHYVGRLPDSWHVFPTKQGLRMRHANSRASRCMNFYQPDQAYTITPSRLSHWRFSLDARGRPLTMAHIDSGNLYDYNTRPADPPGINNPEWRAFTGTYLALLSGAIPDMMTIRLKNGSLFLIFDNPAKRITLRLDEHLPRLFFTSTGEAIDFTSEQPLFCGVLVRRIGHVEKARQWLILLRGLIHFWLTRKRFQLQR
jgi:CubicO group peptidase (beta-lactamase class C family)